MANIKKSEGKTGVYIILRGDDGEEPRPKNRFVITKHLHRRRTSVSAKPRRSGKLAIKFRKSCAWASSRI